ncbi:MAG: glutamate--cysteine ligase [Stagnimonas sp.]|nr:glutamate--cysteine ligase [Stagnimonas sp.]
MLDARHPSVPNLTTAHSAPLLRFEKLLLEQAPRIEGWFRREFHKTPAPFYCSVDLRNAGYKLAVVDTNLFPAGFNNLNPAFEPLAIHALQSALEKLMPSACNLVLVPENHTRNLYYLEAVATLRDLIGKAGYTVRIGSINPAVTEPLELPLPSGKSLRLEPLQRDGDYVYLDGFKPCLVLLHNDLSGGRPAILEGLKQPVVPHPKLGWSDRLKSGHFTIYQEVAEEFAEQLGIDPWLVNPLFRNCGEINFLKREGEECLAANVELLLEDIKAKYAEYGVTDEPFVIVKSDAGTYGMGVMTVKSVDEIRNMNRDTRKKMASAKEGNEVTGAILQEGVYTFEHWQDAATDSPLMTAEPVVYMIDHYVVGGFYRVHAGRSNTENLNAPGAQFRQLAFNNACNCPEPDAAPDAEPNKFYAYGVVARLALLAAAREAVAALASDAN